ncbi:hypothetical protein BBK36DRAFT_1155048 [Trichoderma citrinoviride]|uniref:Uncharacterized protein n=1 Tax=Trichoderma citrinoviride TaxID=58853 RepID=A0A2T4BLN9_9HYPO|nr:hypothetical protein BBK36DRAFT_1155048 [Trichoderma citrinoviride]PTB70232.1 hypothetical protein BBK36DRAFT_1155048 [Trichoderma citrinoviride]
MIFTKGLLSAAVAVFELASFTSAGIAHRADTATAAATYSDDGRTCCTDGEPGTALINGKCEYGSHSLSPDIPSGTHVTKCCWDDKASDFHVHYAQDNEEHEAAPLNVTGGGNYPNGFCNLGLKWEITEFILTDDYLDLNIDLNVDCGPYNKSDREWVRIHFNSVWQDAGKFTYVISSIGPTIYADISTKIKRDDSSVDLHVHVTGTGIAGALDESVDENLHDEELKAILSTVNVCY